MGTKHALTQERVIVVTDETRNKEGYLDMVPFLAIKDMAKKESRKGQKTFGFRPVVYICSPYSGDVESNTEKARRYSRFAVDKGMIPFAPHLLLPQYMSEENERDLALFMGSVFLDKCAELWCSGTRCPPEWPVRFKGRSSRTRRSDTSMRTSTRPRALMPSQNRRPQYELHPFIGKMHGKRPELPVSHPQGDQVRGRPEGSRRL